MIDGAQASRAADCYCSARCMEFASVGNARLQTHCRERHGYDMNNLGLWKLDEIMIWRMHGV